MKSKKCSFIIGVALFMSIVGATASPTNDVKFIDSQSPKGIVPFIDADSVSKKLLKKQWKLVFSDEFNDNKVDTAKWTVENSIKKRVDITLYADSNQVEEKNGNIYIYYRKTNVNDTTYNAGRFNSRGKYAPTYGFLGVSYACSETQRTSDGILDDA